jgi:hypothetical protein
MRICLPCHDALACENQHDRIILRAPGAGPTCGICGGDLTDVECFCPAAREIDSFNRAMRTFSLSMRRKFIQNMDKGGWQDIDWGFGIKRLLHEAGELAEVCSKPIKGLYELPEIIDESSDVANFALFLACRAWTTQAIDKSIAERTDKALKEAESKKETKKLEPK